MGGQDEQVFLPAEYFCRATDRTFAAGPIRPILLGSVSVKGGKKP